MNLNMIISALRQRCPSFEQRIAGAAEYGHLAENTTLKAPAAFVVPMDENPEQNRSTAGYRQTTREAFAVIIVLDNKADERGQASSNNIDAFRREIFRALLGWEITPDYEGVEFEGGSLLSLDRARLWYQFEFAAETDLAADDTYKEIYLEGLPAFESASIGLDAIDPAADPNVQYPGPDGRIEHQINLDIPQE